VQEHLRGRFYISPSMLYSVARLARGGHNYEVPVAGEWVTIGVIAERGQISVSRGYGSRVQHSTAEAQGQSQLDDLCESSQGASEVVHKSAKKYLTLRLVDFGRRGQDPTTGKSVIKGDALLNMILFESDTVSSLKDAGGSEQRVYKGGSGGVFEASSTLREGAVIVVTNPRILKPFQRAKDKPHPMDNIFAITPQHEASVMIIGTSQDLGKCSALRRDGTTCKSWYDRRVSDVCEYHIQRAVESRRASRPEFSSA
ncbi:uncharacterized protein EI90DRAFT_2919190, partial [Cantharellus anzutake]|uniref:uncharacterized protein n=1 Tax=Cantharellus anzutake TaxID=1750568 RepID=UPI0019061E61